MKKLCYVATIPAVVHAFLRVHIQVAAKDYEITVVCNASDKNLLANINARFIYLDIERKPSLFKDLLVLYRLLVLFRHEKFDIVHSIMPKTGLLAMLAAWLAGVPVRLHTFTGQVWVTMRGARRILYKWLDKCIVSMSSAVLADSPSQRDFLLSENVVAQEKIFVIGSGSICGVDTLRFHPDADERRLVRQELGIKQEASLILYVGRLSRDKGVLDLATAFGLLAQKIPGVQLLLLGAEEDVLFSHIQGVCGDLRDSVHYHAFSSRPERYMAAADIFCLPSYREGFGLSIIEAAACKIPAVATRIYGITDAVEDGITGLLFMPGNVQALVQALLTLSTETHMRQEMGNAAYMRAIAMFDSNKISSELLKLYAFQVLKFQGG